MARSSPERIPPPPEEGVSAVGFFDRDGTVPVRLTYEPTNPTPWLLIHAIPLSVTLSETLRCLDSCSQYDSSFREESDAEARGTTACDRFICAARVGYIPDEAFMYCVILQYHSADDAAPVRQRLQRSALAKGAPPLVEFLRPHDVRCRSSPPLSCSPEEEPVGIEALCRISRGPNEGTCSRVRSRRLTTASGFCSICQEDIALSRPYIITLCQHVFHVDCFQQHRDLLCPICRFSMTSLGSKCHACGTYHDLWTCLVCGCVSCGEGHSNDHKRHFDSTGHSCAMQNDTSRIWNHRRNMFLHHHLAMELGREDDAKADRDAAADGAQRRGSTAEGATASSYRRSRWWWDEKDENAEEELDHDYVNNYYLHAMGELMEEQRVYYERSRGTAMQAELSQTRAAALQQLLRSERRGRRSVVAAYMSGMQHLVQQEKLAFKCYVRQEVLRNKGLSEELMLQSHAIRNHTVRLSAVKGNIQRADGRGSNQIALREAELSGLQKELEEAMRALEE